MNFGVRLPGPFRVGVSSSGGVSAGVTLGPFSASTGVGNRRRPASHEEAFYPIDLDRAIGELVVMGWLPRGHDGRSVILTRGWRAVQVDAVDGGVTWRPITSRRQTIAALVAVAAVIALCAGVFG